MIYLTLLQDVIERLDEAYAPNTLKSYYADGRAFVEWCGVKEVEPFPLRSSGLCAYIEHMQEEYRYTSIRRRISALRRLNTLLGFNDETHT